MFDLQSVFLGDSEMAARMRAFDWSTTPVGPPDTWPPNLKIALGVCLSSRFPMHLCWGRALTLFYNDAYIALLGPAKHPGVLGRSARHAWIEIWDTIGPIVDQVFSNGVASWSEDLPLFVDRQLPQEEVYITFSFSPVFSESGSVDGLFCASTETTGNVIGHRRLDTVRRLASETAAARRTADACAAAGRILALDPHDVPFALLYLLSDEGEWHLAATAGMQSESWQPPAQVLPAEWHALQKSLGDVARTRRPVDLALGEADVLRVTGAWPSPLRHAVVLPILGAAPDRLAGALVAGVSPRRPLDDGYRAFFDLIADHLESALAAARAYEDERARSEALAGVDRMKRDFFSGLSLEFRAPLTRMLGPLEEELQRGTGERLASVHQHARRLLKLANTLVEFSRLEAGRIEAAYAPTDLSALTADVADVFRSAATKAGLTLRIDCPPLPAPAYVDRDMWEQIVLNLISNGLKFTFEGEIEVAMRSADGQAVLTVRDTGGGIPAEAAPHIFDRFRPGRGARARTHDDSGIGLALVQQLVRLHGGTMRVASTDGHGSTFSVSIPLGSSHLPAQQVMRSHPPVEGSRARRAEFADEAARWVSESDSSAGQVDSPANDAASPRAVDHTLPGKDLDRLVDERTDVLRASEARQSFLVRFNDAIRPLGDAHAVQEAACRLLGEHLGANRVGYAEDGGDGETVTVTRNFADGVAGIEGAYRYRDFGPHVLQSFLEGRTVVLSDVHNDPALTPTEKSAYTALQIRATANVPLVKGDRIVAILFLHYKDAHVFSADELSLLEDVAERTWWAVTRARAEVALRHSEERLRSLNESLEDRVRHRTSDVARAHASLEALFTRLISAQEEERRRIARDIHDQLGQPMTALRLNLEALRLDAAGHVGRLDQIDRTQQLAADLDTSIDQLTAELRPATLDLLGLAAALQHLVTGWSARFAVAAEFDTVETGAFHLQPEAEEHLYRITQEALHNVVKHAGATRVSVRLERHDAGVILTIADDGLGFDPQRTREPSSSGGLGLPSMRERARLAGGTLDMASARGRGTTVVARIPG